MNVTIKLIEAKVRKIKGNAKNQEGNLIHSKYYCHCYQTSNTDTMHAVVQWLSLTTWTHRGFKHIFRVRDKRLEQERERKREGNYDGKSSGNKRQGKRGMEKKLKQRREWRLMRGNERLGSIAYGDISRKQWREMLRVEKHRRTSARVCTCTVSERELR